jgi:hypothetical protein
MKKIKILCVISILMLSGILVGAGTTIASCPCECTCPCRWTGGGTIGTGRDPRVTHGFELHCNDDQLPNNLEVNWGGNHFHLDVITSVGCDNHPGIDPAPPVAPCDRIFGEGDGRLNGVSGYHVVFYFTDAGEPGKNDHAEITIYAPDGKIVLEVNGNLKSGNQQAHRVTGHDA